VSEQRVYTIAEAAEATGATVKAIRNRCDRGQLRFVLKNGVRKIPLSELRRAGLLEVDAELEATSTADASEARELVSRELLAELAAAHETIGTLRALTERSSSTEADLEEARRSAAALERDRHELELERARLAGELERLRSRPLLARLRNR
jgi:hypothetical protein